MKERRTSSNGFQCLSVYFIGSKNVHSTISGQKRCVIYHSSIRQWVFMTFPKTLLTVIISCGRYNDSSSYVSKSWATFSFFVLICLTSQRSGRPPDLWHCRRSAEHIPVIRKEKPGAAGTHGSVCHTATAGLRASLSHAVAKSLLYQTTCPSILWALAPKGMHAAYNVTT